MRDFDLIPISFADGEVEEETRHAIVINLHALQRGLEGASRVVRSRRR